MIADMTDKIERPKSLRDRLHSLRYELLHPKPAKEEDVALVTILLSELPAKHAQAVMKFYHGASEEEAIRGARLKLDQFRALRAALRGRFFQRTGRLAS